MGALLSMESCCGKIGNGNGTTELSAGCFEDEGEGKDGMQCLGHRCAKERWRRELKSGSARKQRAEERERADRGHCPELHLLKQTAFRTR